MPSPKHTRRPSTDHQNPLPRILALSIRHHVRGGQDWLSVA